MGRMAYVILGAPFVSQAAWIYWEGIEPMTNISSIEIEACRRGNPQLCLMMGMRALMTAPKTRPRSRLLRQRLRSLGSQMG